MIYPGFGTTYVVDLESEKNTAWKINTTVYVLETSFYYILTPSRTFVLLTALPGAGETNLGANVGGGTGTIFRNKSSVTLNFKSLIAGAGIGLTNGADDITITNTAPHIAHYKNNLVLGSDVAAGATNAFQDITGLSFAVTNGAFYRVRATLLYSVIFSTTGLRISYTGPTMTRMAKMVQVPATLTGSTANLWTDSSSAADTGDTSISSMSTGSNICVADFIFEAGAAGTFQLRFASEVSAAGSVVIEAGSTLEWW